MTTFKSDFLNVLSSRGFVHQISEPDALDALAQRPGLTAYIGFDCTAPSLHAGSLIPIMMLYWLQQTGGRPIALMGGGTTRVGDPSGKDESRRLLTDDDIARNLDGIRAVFEKFLKFGAGARRRRDGEQCRLAQPAQLHRFPARCRPPLLGQPHARLQFRQAAARPPAGAVVPGVQLHDPPGLRLRGAVQARGLRAADGRLRPVGQHRQRHRPRPPPGECPVVRAHHAAAHDVVGRQDGQDRRRRGVARPRHGEPVRLLAVLAQHRGRRRRALPQAAHGAAARRDRAARQAARRRHQRGEEGARHRDDGAGPRPRRGGSRRRHRAPDLRGRHPRREPADRRDRARRTRSGPRRARSFRREGEARCLQRRSPSPDQGRRPQGQRRHRDRREGDADAARRDARKA